MEVCHIIQPAKPPTLISARKTSADHDTSSKTRMANNLTVEGQTDSGFNSGHENFTPSNIEKVSSEGSLTVGQGHSPALTPSAGSSGSQTPVFSDQLLQSCANDSSWLIKLCVKNVMPYTGSGSKFSSNTEDVHVEPLPVRLESLQVLAHLSKCYFPILR